MGPWRDKRSLPVLFLGLAFLFLEIKPIASLEQALRPSVGLVLPLAKALQPFRLGGRSSAELPGTSPEKVPDSSWLSQREAAFLRPKDERLLGSLVVFASRASDASEPGTMWLEAGAEHGVREGMFAVVGDALLGEIVRAESHRCLVRLPTHPASQLGARVGETRFIAASGRHGTMRVELPSARAFDSGGEVRGDPLPAVLGRLESMAGGRKGSFVVRPALNPSLVHGAWILRQGEVAGGHPPRDLVVAPSAGAWTRASGLWPEISPHARGGVFRVEDAGSVAPGAAVTEGSRLFGFVQRASGDLAWVRALGDPALRFDALLARDDGAVIAIPSLPLGDQGAGSLRFPAKSPGLGEGWLFTAGGKEGTPKGVLVGRVRRDEEGFVLDGLPRRLPNAISIARGGAAR